MTEVTLGIAVDSSEVRTAKQDVDNFTDSAKKGEDQAKKTGDAIGKIGGGQSAEQLKKTAAAADDLARSLAKLQGSSAVGVTSAIEQVAAKTGASYEQAAASVKTAYESVGRFSAAAQVAAPAAQALGAGISVAGAAATSAAAAVTAKTSALRQLNQGLRTASPLLNEFSGGLGHVLTGATRVRGSIAVLAAVVAGELAIGMAKAGEEIFRSQKLFEALTGSAKSGNEALTIVKETARSSAVDFGVMQGAIQHALEGAIKFSGVKSGDQKQAIVELTGAFGTLSKVMQSVGANADDKKHVFSALADSFQKTGTLTAEAFDKIRAQSEPTAKAIANAFNVGSVDVFRDILSRTPASIGAVVTALDSIKGSADKAFDENPVKSYSQAVGEVKTAWSGLLETVANTGSFSAAATAIDLLAQSIAGWALIIKYAISAANDAVSAGKSVGSSDIKGLSEPQLAPSPFGDLPGFASGGSFVVDGSGGTDSQVISFKATPGEVVTIDTPGSKPSDVASLTPVTPDDNTDLKDLFDKQTSQIVSAINSLKSSSQSSSSAIVSASDAIARNMNAVGGGYSSGGVGGGGISASGGKSPRYDPPTNYAASSGMGGDRSVGGYGYAGANFGQGSTITGGFGDENNYGSDSGSGWPQFAYFGGSDPYYGATGSSFSDGGSSYYGSSGGSFSDTYSNDPGSSYFGNDSYYAGQFATGGRFTVGGDGGTDTTPVKFMATRGETVTITPAGMKIPSGINVSPNMLRPSSGDSAGWNKPTVTHQSSKEVNIFVHDKMQAEGFLRSRAQIARAM